MKDLFGYEIDEDEKKVTGSSPFSRYKKGDHKMQIKIGYLNAELTKKQYINICNWVEAHRKTWQKDLINAIEQKILSN